ncbi:MAG: SNF2-related protein [Candidatus Methanomethylicaceae archaeon]
MIFTPLMRHQVEAVGFVLTRPVSALFMRQGTGKSLVALAAANELKAKKILITSDKNNVLNTWPEQIATHSDFDFYIRKLPAKWSSPTCVVVNYDFLAARWKQFVDVDWDFWIGDESSEIKDCHTKRVRFSKLVVCNIPYRIILNGSPMTENIEDLFGQFLLLDGGERLGRTLTSFRSRFMMKSLSGYGWVPLPSALTLIKEAIRDIVWWPDLSDVRMPKRVFEVRQVEMTEEQRAQDEQLASEFRISLTNEDLNYAVTVFMKRLQLCGGFILSEDKAWRIPTNKFKALQTVLDEDFKKIVVWHHFVAETELLSEHLFSVSTPRKVFVVDCAERASSVLSSFASADAGILLIRDSLCKGLNALANADCAVFWSYPFSYRTRCQALGRTCRMTSEAEKTFVIDLVTEGGVDEQVRNMLALKQDVGLTLHALHKLAEKPEPT